MKFEIHTVQYQTKRGINCLHHYRFAVFSGKNPMGPRGGKCGRATDGHAISSEFGKREQAENFIKDYLLALNKKEIH